jgi:hypothetical protein
MRDNHHSGRIDCLRCGRTGLPAGVWVKIALGKKGGEWLCISCLQDWLNDEKRGNMNLNKEQRIRLYKDAIEKWGEDLQLNLVIEESSELIKVVSKLIRSRQLSKIDPKNAVYVDIDKVVDEIADVKIMLEQLELIFDLDLKVEKQIGVKIGKLKNQLKK